MVEVEEARQPEAGDEPQLGLQPLGRLARGAGCPAGSGRRSARGRSRPACGRRRRPPRPGSGSRGRWSGRTSASSASRAVSATASGWSAKRAAIACRRRRGRARGCRGAAGSDASSVVCSRIATNASCSRARSRVCAWTLPVATHGTPSRSASDARPRFSARSWRWNGRCSSTRNASRPNAASSRRIVGSSRTPLAAQPLRQTSPSACCSRSSSVTRGASTIGPPSGARVCACALREQPAEVRPARRVADEQRHVARERRLGVAAQVGGRASGARGRSTARRSRRPPPRGSPAAPTALAACANSIEP